jgi:hypothetical protein
MATQSNVPQLNPRSKSAAIICRLRSYRPYDPDAEPEALEPEPRKRCPRKRRRKPARRSKPLLFIVPRLLAPEPGPDDDTQSGPDAVTSRG